MVFYLLISNSTHKLVHTYALIMMENELSQKVMTESSTFCLVLSLTDKLNKVHVQTK